MTKPFQAIGREKIMSVSIVGISSGELARGTHAINDDLMIKFHSEVYPHDYSVQLYLEDNGWPRLIIKARRMRPEKFANMSDQEIQEWFLENVGPGGGKGKRFLPDETLIEVISSGAKSKLPSNLIEGIMSVQEIQEKLNKPTLALYFHLWEGIIVDYRVPNEKIDPGQLIYYRGRVLPVKDISGEDVSFFRFNISLSGSKGESIFIGADEGPPWTLEQLAPLIDLDLEIYRKVKIGTGYFTASGYKSLLQKIIRQRPEKVSLALPTSEGKGWHLFDASQVLMSVFLLLYLHPGSFVPDLQRFVRGKESALKRLAISIVEDSYTRNIEGIVDLLGNALAAQYIKNFEPDISRVVIWIDLLKDSLANHLLSNYSTSEFNPSGHPGANLLYALGSFSSDINMMSSLLPHPRPGSEKRPSVMDVSRAIDQHWAPNLIYFFPLAFLREYVRPGSNPYREVMSLIWLESSSWNPRLLDEPEQVKFRKSRQEPSGPIYEIIAQGQRDYHAFSLGLITGENFNLPSLSRTILDQVLVKDILLPPAYLSSHLGVLYTRVEKQAVMVCIDCNDINQLSVTRKPGRNQEDIRLTPELEDLARKQIRERLAKGINGVKYSETSSHDSVIGQWTVDGRPLDDWLRKSWTVSLFRPGPWKEGMVDLPGQETSIASSEPPDLSEFEPEDLNRAKYYFMIADDEIVFPSVSRDGGNVVPRDMGAFKIISKLASYYPYILVRTGLVTFRVTSKELLKSIRLTPSTEVFEFASDDLPSTMDGLVLSDSRAREPYLHQTEALEELIGKKFSNSFIWIPVGMGKTYIICSYLAYLGQTSTAQDLNIIYTLPKSASSTVIDEMSNWGLSVNRVIPLSKMTWTIQPFVAQGTKFWVNLIEHDHLRLIESELEKYIDKTVFIIDEVHKTLSETQRSSAALTLASLCHHFVAMTGTPTINTDMSLLINWLKLTINFPINKHNFWIAISSLISKQVNTGIKVIQENFIVSFDRERNQKYLSLVGPSLGGTNDKVRAEDIREAFDLSYRLVSETMIPLVLNYLEDGVFLVARNGQQQQELKKLLVEAGLSEREIGLVDREHSFNLIKPEDPGPRVVIATTGKSEGYTLTKLGVMITSVYFSNLATRQQLDGRINRISQVRPEILKITISTSLLELVQSKYQYVGSVDAALKVLSQPG